MDLLVIARRLVKQETRTIIFEPAADPAAQASLIKLYRHRGICNTLRGWLVRYRAQREFEMLEYLSANDISCTHPVGWSRGFSPEHGFYEALVMRKIPATETLGEAIGRDGRIDLAPLFAIVRRMHAAGVRHQALYARNILVCSSGGRQRFFIADMPRSRIFPRSIRGTRMAMLDTVDLIASMRHAGLRDEQVALRAWGYEADEARRMEAMLGRYSKARPLRIARDVETRLRHAFMIVVTALSGFTVPPA